MKINCSCGNVLIDSTDRLPFKAYILPDQNFFPLLDSIDKLIESNKKDRHALCMAMRREVIQAIKQAWQCSSCGNLYLDHQEKTQSLHSFVPLNPETSKEVFKGR